MSKNNIVIITTRWINVWKDPEGVEKTPIHRSINAKFIENDISSADIVADFLHSYTYTNDKFYSLNDGTNYVIIIPCFDKDYPCPDPQGWINALVNQFSKPGDCIYLMLHASSDLRTESGIYNTPVGIGSRALKIRAFSHSVDIAPMILLEETYSKANVILSAEQITRYVSNLFIDLKPYASKLKSVWDDFRYGEASIEDVKVAYEQLCIKCPKESDVRGLSIIHSVDELIEKAQERSMRINITRWINQLTAKF